MKKLMMIFTLASIGCTSTVVAQISPVSPFSKAPDVTACAGLADDYDSIEQELSALSMDGLTDNSAARASLREQRANNQYVRANAAIELMRANGCPMPRHAPGTVPYFEAAMDCEMALRSGLVKAPACDRANWKRRSLK